MQAATWTSSDAPTVPAHGRAPAEPEAHAGRKISPFLPENPLYTGKTGYWFTPEFPQKVRIWENPVRFAIVASYTF